MGVEFIVGFGTGLGVGLGAGFSAAWFLAGELRKARHTSDNKKQEELNLASIFRTIAWQNQRIIQLLEGTKK